MIKITDIKDSEIRFSNETPFITFKTEEAVYHIWLRKIDGFWQIDGKLHKRLHIDNRDEGSSTLNPFNKTNAPILKYLMEVLDVKSLDAKIEEIKRSRESEHLARTTAMIIRQAKSIRGMFAKLSSKERINHLKIAYDVLANHPDDNGLVDLARKLNKAREDAE